MISNALAGAVSEAKTDRCSLFINRRWAEHTLPEHCEFTGVKFGVGLYAPAITRVQRAGDFVEGNCYWVLKGIHALRRIGNTEDVVKLAELLKESMAR